MGRWNSVNVAMREAVESDLDVLEAIHAQNMRSHVEKIYPWNPELFQKGFSPKDYTVVLDREEVIGMTKVVPSEDSLYLAEIQIRLYMAKY